VPQALAWAETQKHRLAECQSVQNLIKVVDDWLKKNSSPKPEANASTQKRRPRKDLIAELEQFAHQTTALVVERDEVISDLKSKVATQDDTIDDLRKRLAEREEDIVKIQDPLTDEIRHLRFSSSSSAPFPARDRVMILLSVKAGLRAYEIAGLEWSMVLDARGKVGDILAIHDAIAKKRGGRRIPMHRDLRSALRRLLRISELSGPVMRSARGGWRSPFASDHSPQPTERLRPQIPSRTVAAACP